MILTRRQVVDAAWCIPALENAVLALKTTLCDGSFLKGYTPTTREVSQAELNAALENVRKALRGFP